MRKPVSGHFQCLVRVESLRTYFISTIGSREHIRRVLHNGAGVEH